MPTKDKRIDAYIAKAQPFAQAILKHLRSLVHTACPNVEETMKWSFPHFDYKGEMMCSMAAFKQHAVFGFWKAKLLKDPKGYLGKRSSEGGTAMGHFGRITNVKDLPPDKTIIDFIKQAMKLNDTGVKLSPRPKLPKKELTIPSYFLHALRKHKEALTTFKAFSHSHKKEYVEWITEAKTNETRENRMATAIEWLAKGKPRNWKYLRQKN
jgi:uncharacterized protein YdeI (YjbR/CyaY-like superfamily)